MITTPGATVLSPTRDSQMTHNFHHISVIEVQVGEFSQEFCQSLMAHLLLTLAASHQEVSHMRFQVQLTPLRLLRTSGSA